MSCSNIAKTHEIVKLLHWAFMLILITKSFVLNLPNVCLVVKYEEAPDR